MAKRDIEKAQLIINSLSPDCWKTYQQISGATKISVGGISQIIWSNVDKIRDKILWETEVYGKEDWQSRMLFKLKPVNNHL